LGVEQLEHESDQYKIFKLCAKAEKYRTFLWVILVIKIESKIYTMKLF